MTRFHATSEGNIPFTAAEELERDAEEQAYTAGADAREAEEVRFKRNTLLAGTDYRQALRDVPAQAGFPSTIAWPTSP